MDYESHVDLQTKDAQGVLISYFVLKIQNESSGRKVEGWEQNSGMDWKVAGVVGVHVMTDAWMVDAELEE